MKYLSKLRKKDLFGKTALVRAGFDLLNEDINLLRGKIPFRIQAILPTLKFLLKYKTKIVLLSHRGRPEPMNAKTSVSARSKNEEQFSLAPLGKILEKMLARRVIFIPFRLPIEEFARHAHVAIEDAPLGSIFLLENLRFFNEETASSARFGKALSRLGDIYVNDSFNMDHRNNASVDDIPKFLPSYAGFSLANEITNLSRARQSKRAPLILIVGGAKVSDKMRLLYNLLPRARHVLVGGGVANTFNAAVGINVGESLYEKAMIKTAKQFLKSGKIVLPVDFSRRGTKILDIGEKTIHQYRDIIKNAKVIVWSGPMGLTSDSRFRKGSYAVAEAILRSKAFAAVGGGETVSVFQMVLARHPRMSCKHVFLSTGGGAMLEYLSGKKLPGIEALN